MTLEQELDAAVDAVAEALHEELGEAPDLLVAFGAVDQMDQLPGALVECFPDAVVVGCSAAGVIGAGHEVEHRSALSVTGARLPDVEIHPFAIGPDALAGGGLDAPAFTELLGLDAAAVPPMIVLSDPFTCDVDALVRGVDAAYGRSAKVGGLASGGRRPGDHVLLVGDEARSSGAVGVALSGNIALDTIVAQGCRPVGNPLFVTRSRGNLILELDGRRPVELIEELHASLNDQDRALMRDSLFIGLAIADQRQSYQRGDFLVRNLLGVDPEQGALAVAASLRDNVVVQFQLRDAATSAEDLRELLEAQETPPAGALLFSCVGRGTYLYGRTGHDSEMFQDRLGPVPLGGFFCNGEIGPVQGQTQLHSYTSCFGLFRPAG